MLFTPAPASFVGIIHIHEAHTMTVHYEAGDQLPYRRVTTVGVTRGF